ncbi:MAG: uroporphyrinogen decarboxylase family protein [Candidatus Aminicenantaceae bacterium]
MTSKKRFLAALNKKIPDMLPVTTHHVMPYFLKTYMSGISYQDFFDHFGLDPIRWIVAHKPDISRGEYCCPEQKDLRFLEPPLLCSDKWRIKTETVPHPEYKTVRISFLTPKETLSMVLQNNDYTTWITERMIKDKSDIDILAEYAPIPICDVEDVNRQTETFGERGMVRGSIPGFDICGQPGCWQDAAVLYGTEKLILETFSDPQWVHALLGILKERKKHYIQSMEGAEFDIIEHGGGDASSTVISPQIFEDFVAPYDAELIRLIHLVKQRVVYHTCGGMMPILEKIADMNPDAMETFTPPAMGGDVDLKKAKERIGDRVCMTGGFDQFHYFNNCTPEETRREVRRCFDEAGEGGGYILSPSDHFFDADVELIRAYVDEARKCVY